MVNSTFALNFIKIPLAKLKPNHTSMVRAKEDVGAKIKRDGHFSSVWERSDLPGVAAYLSLKLSVCFHLHDAYQINR